MCVAMRRGRSGPLLERGPKGCHGLEQIKSASIRRISSIRVLPSLLSFKSSSKREWVDGKKIGVKTMALLTDRLPIPPDQ